MIMKGRRTILIEKYVRDQNKGQNTRGRLSGLVTE